MARGVVVRLTRAAAQDLRDAAAHYLAIDAALSEALREEFDNLVVRLEMFPGSGTPVEGMAQVRRARLKRFPYGVFYRQAEEAVVILRILHNRRDVPPELVPDE